MIKIKKLTLAIFTLLTYNVTFASSINKHIELFFTDKFAIKPEKMHIEYMQAEPQLMCEKPHLELTNTKRLWGKVTILAQCEGKKQFIQLNVKVIGSYVIANRPIPVGSLLVDNELSYQKGRLDTLDDSVILDKAQVIDQVAVTNIHENQPIKRIMLRKKWLIMAGEPTPVILRGNGYQVVTSGKSLANASLNDQVNVRIHSSRKIINGLVTKEGIIVFNKN